MSAPALSQPTPPATRERDLRIRNIAGGLFLALLLLRFVVPLAQWPVLQLLTSLVSLTCALIFARMLHRLRKQDAAG